MKGIIDSTLREGEQAVGVSFSPASKLEMIRHLDSIGVEEIEVGIVNPYDRVAPELISRARKEGCRARLALWCRCLPKDIRLGAAAGPDILSLSVPVSDLHIEKKLGRSREWVLDSVKESIRYALELGVPAVSLGLEDATRSDRDFLFEVVRTAQIAGACRVRLADTVGIADPLSISELVKELKTKFEIEVGVHMHNDFGMATANAIAALEAGADWADVTILGLGERAGNARLEEILAYLALKRERSYKIKLVPTLSRLVAGLAGVDIQPRQPIIGRDIFSCETGLHLQGLKKDPATYEPFAPEVTGANRRLLYGSKTGRKEIENWFAESFMEGEELTDLSLDLIMAELKKGTTGLPPMTMDKFHAILEDIRGKCKMCN